MEGQATEAIVENTKGSESGDKVHRRETWDSSLY